MILGYRDKRTRVFAERRRVTAFAAIERPAQLKLDRLEAATALKDLVGLPGNGFEALKGNRAGQDSIRINNQWRICFEWPDGLAGPINLRLTEGKVGKTTKALRTLQQWKGKRQRQASYAATRG